MEFSKLVANRQSTRSYNPDRAVEDEKIMAILNSVRLSPSACNSQPYHFTVCKGETAKSVAKATIGLGMNKFSVDAPVIIVVSERPYNVTAGLGAKVKKNDYRSMDIGIAVSLLTLEATAQGLGTCILGYFDEGKIQSICKIKDRVRLVVTLGYPCDGDVIRNKKRKSLEELVTFID